MSAKEVDAAEIDRLRAENENLRRWKALDKHITAAMAIVQSDTQKLRADNARLQARLAMIADIAEGSGTVNSLPHIAKIARGEC